MQGDIDRLASIQGTGSRGRIFHALVKEMFHALEMANRPEPVFEPIPPKPWYVQFSQDHQLKLRIDPFYNPDFILEDGSWIEVTLSENTAYRKLLKYGHQADRLIVLWLDVDYGLHKDICRGVAFPNAEVKRIDGYYDQLEENGKGDLVRRFEMLKELKGNIL